MKNYQFECIYLVTRNGNKNYNKCGDEVESEKSGLERVRKAITQGNYQKSVRPLVIILTLFRGRIFRSFKVFRQAKEYTICFSYFCLSLLIIF